VHIAIASDHAGYELKGELVRFLEEAGHTVRDYGTHRLDSVDYPDHGRPAAHAVASGECERGILICGTGLGMSYVANKVRGIRAALCQDCFTARFSRLHNDSNVLCLGARVLGVGLAEEIVGVWLSTQFSGQERHQRRIEKVMALETESS
jgi:ribose 5-phosphate isomerase B